MQRHGGLLFAAISGRKRQTTASLRVYNCSNIDPYPRIRGVVFQKAHRAAPVILQHNVKQNAQKSDQTADGAVNIQEQRSLDPDNSVCTMPSTLHISILPSIVNTAHNFGLHNQALHRVDNEIGACNRLTQP